MYHVQSSTLIVPRKKDFQKGKRLNRDMDCIDWSNAIHGYLFFSLSTQSIRNGSTPAVERSFLKDLTMCTVWQIEGTTNTRGKAETVISN